MDFKPFPEHLLPHRATANTYGGNCRLRNKAIEAVLILITQGESSNLSEIFQDTGMSEEKANEISEALSDIINPGLPEGISVEESEKRYIPILP